MSQKLFMETGTVTGLDETREISDTFRVREFRVCPDQEANYPQHVSFQLIGEDCDTVLQQGEIGIGDTVTVSFTIGGRQSKGGRFFNTLNCRGIQRDAEALVDATPKAQQVPLTDAPAF